jgi:formate-dependent nitrite reductase membrane component NrfD
MNLFVADPGWHWLIVLYFYLGGIAAGAYFLAALIDLVGDADDCLLARAGYWIAFPLVAVCGLLLTVDLDRPDRFWHMLFQSEVVRKALDEGWPLGGWGWMLQAPLLKYWSPMSVGAWALLLFGLFSFLSLLASVWPGGRLAQLLGRNWFGVTFKVLGSAVGFFIASYTGALLTATNQPLWSQSEWIAPLFLASSASTGIAAVFLLSRWRGDAPAETLKRLERADLRALGLELVVFAIFLASLGVWLIPVWRTWEGMLLIIGTLVLGLLLPLALQLGLGGSAPWRDSAAAVLALVGGFILRYAIVMTPPDLLARGPRTSPETLTLSLWETAAGKVLLAVVLALAVAAPLVVHWRLRPGTHETVLAGVAAVLTVAGVLFYSLGSPANLSAAQSRAWFRFSPEDARPRGGGGGASPFNRAGPAHPRSKIPETAGP